MMAEQNMGDFSYVEQLPTDIPSVLFSGVAPFLVTDVNDVWLCTCGYSRKEVIGNTMRIIQGPGTDRPTCQKLMVNMRKRLPFEAILTNYTKDRQPIRNELKIVPVVTSGGPGFMAQSLIHPMQTD